MEVAEDEDHVEVFETELVNGVSINFLKGDVDDGLGE